MREATFETKQEALDAGWKPIPKGRKRVLAEDDDYVIQIQDRSGTHSYGYRYAVVAVMIHPEGDVRRVGPNGWPWEKVLLESTTVRMNQQKNKIGKPGAFSEMFHEDDLSAALEEGREWVEKQQEKLAPDGGDQTLPRYELRPW